MALYQKVHVSSGFHHRGPRRLDSTSSAPRDFSSDSSQSDDSLSSSLLDATQPQHPSKHHRNYQHINSALEEVNIAPLPSPSKTAENKQRFAISRRATNIPANPVADPILHETESDNLCIPPPPPYHHLDPSPAHALLRKYTPSSDPSTLPSITTTLAPSAPQPRPPAVSMSLPVPACAPSVMVPPSGCEDKQWNYAYSYASSTMAPKSRHEMDDHKTIDSPNHKLTHRPVLTTELQPILQEMKISETNSNHSRQRSLYSGFVTPNPIEIHNELMRLPKLPGPLLIFRTLFADDMDRISSDEYLRKSSKTRKELGYIPIFALPIQCIQLNVDVCLRTALCEMKIVFINNCGKAIKDALFTLPIIGKGTVRNISVCIQNNKTREKQLEEGKRFIETFVVTSDVMDDSFDGIFKRPLNEYIPGLFRFPIEWIGSHDAIEITAQWKQSLHYKDGRYHLNVPLQFAHNILPNNVNLSEIVHINVILNTFVSCVKFGSNSHNLSITDTLHEAKETHLLAIPSEHDIQSKDFHMAYYVETNKVTGCAFISKDNDHGIQHGQGQFVLYINPNTDHKYNNKYDVFGRDIIFLIDRSASMQGSYSKVLQGLTSALDMLHHKDKFGIVCFNETQIYFHGKAEPSQKAKPVQVDLHSIVMRVDGETKQSTTPPIVHDMIAPKCPLFEATAEYIDCAKQFVVNYVPEGGTDIVTPLRWALNMLNNGHKQHRASCHGMPSIPYIVLITDGCDYQEKEILNDIHIELCCQNVRILTFGIGSYCNAHFLTLLSMRSRGWSDHVMYGSDIKNGIESLMQKCQAPVLRDLCIEDDITNNEAIDLYPSNGAIPDLYIDGAPIIVYGTYRNDELMQILMETNHTIRVSGVSVNGEPKIYEFKVNYDAFMSHTLSMPIHEIGLKPQINALMAKHWLHNALDTKQMIVALCVKYKTCLSSYVSMLCCECRDKDEKYNLDINALLSSQTHRNVTKIGVINQDCVGVYDTEINNFNICGGILNSIGQLIDDDIHKSTMTCCAPDCCKCCCLL
eukprot:339589_1